MIRYQNLIAIDMADLKRISRSSGANLTSLIFAGVSGAVMKTMKARGGNIWQDATSLYILPGIFPHAGTLMNNLYVRILNIY